jgi:hypothetical protein
LAAMGAAAVAMGQLVVCWAAKVVEAVVVDLEV